MQALPFEAWSIVKKYHSESWPQPKCCQFECRWNCMAWDLHRIKIATDDFSFTSTWNNAKLNDAQYSDFVLDVLSFSILLLPTHSPFLALSLSHTYTCLHSDRQWDVHMLKEIQNHWPMKTDRKKRDTGTPTIGDTMFINQLGDMGNKRKNRR